MIYNENGIILNSNNIKDIITIGEYTFSKSELSYICEDAIFDSPKFKQNMQYIKDAIEECDDENVKKLKYKAPFLTEKIKNIIFWTSAAIAAVSSISIIAFHHTTIDAIIFALGGLFAISLSAMLLIDKFPSKDRHLISVGWEVVKFYDKISVNEKLPEEIREKAMADARNLAVRIRKAESAVEGFKYWYENDWGIGSDIRVQNKMIYFANDISNTRYEENKAYYDKAIREINSKVPKIMKDLAKKVKNDYKNNENIKNLSVAEIEKAYGIYTGTMYIVNKGANEEKIMVELFVAEKDSFDKTATNIPIVLGKVLKLVVNYNPDGKINYDYYETDMRSYG